MPVLMAQPDSQTIPSKANRFQVATQQLLQYCHARDWAGYDPYDALNSHLLQALPFRNRRLPCLLLTQLVKRSPINLRPLLSIPPSHNAKGIALFLSAALRLDRLGLLPDKTILERLLQLLPRLRSTDKRYWSWGYNFPWQSRTGLFPLGSPNIICTTFVGNALLDTYEATGNREYLEMSSSAAQFIQDELYYQKDGVSCYSYRPGAHTQVHNANLLGAAFLCRIDSLCGTSKYRESSLKAVRYSVSRQAPDGSWAYGEHSTQNWIDNFHTGYNLCALRAISRFASSTEFDVAIKRGYQFYRQNFLLDDGTPKYYHNRTYPIDIHAAAQSMLTLLEFADTDSDVLAKANQVGHWALDHMWSPNGCFFFQKHPYFTNRTSFMRWSQAWMLFALASILKPNQ